MKINNEERKRIEGLVLVAVTAIAAELSEVMDTAKEITIGAANAKATSARAGDKARGFLPLTDYIDELARASLKVVHRINVEALDASRTASREFRAQDAKAHFDSALAQIDDGISVHGIQQAIERLRGVLTECREGFQQHIKRLLILLEELDRNMRTAETIAVSCRVEASRAEEYEGSLGTVADNLARASTSIRSHVGGCARQLDEAMVLRQAMA